MSEDKPEYFQPAVGQSEMNRLHAAAYSGDLQAVILAIRDGVDVNSQDNARWTPLHWVVDMGMVDGERAEIIDALVAAGADLNLRDWSGRTPLIVACGAGNGDLVRQLIEAGASLEGRDNRDGHTALLEAAHCRLPEAVSLMLQRGADPDAKGHDGKTALDLVRERGWEEMVVVLSATPRASS